MASSHSSSPVPQSNSSDAFFKKEMDVTKRFRPVQSLPDVCPKEPTGDPHNLCDSPSLVADQHRWTIYHSKVNLPAALNDPRLAKRESDFFTKTWGVDFVDTEVTPSFYLPQITKEHFALYQQEIAPREKVHERCKSICTPKDTFDGTLLHTHDKSRTDLEQVPKIFMKPDFALEDSLTFNAVLPWSHFSTAGGKGNRDAASSKLLQEKERLVSLVFGLLKQRKLNFYEIYGDEMIITAKNIIKQCVVNTVSQIEEIDTEVVVKLADQMRMMNFPQWFDLLKNIFSKFTIFLKRIKATLNTIRSVVFLVLDKNQKTRDLEDTLQKNSAKDSTVDTEVAYLTHEGMFISDAFSEGDLPPVAADTTSQRNTSPNSEPCSSDSVSEPECTTDSSSSKEQTSSSVTPGGVEMMISDDMKLTDLELVRLANNIQELLYNASDICHDRSVKFLMSRAKDGFLEKLNSNEFVTLSRLMEGFILDTEQICGRKSMSLRGALQSQANRFVNRFHEERKTKLSLLLDNERWKQAEVPAEFQDLVDSVSDGRISLPEKKPAATEERKPAEFLIVEGQKYATVGTVLLLIRIILEYCQCVDNIPSITTDMLTRLSDLLKYFNSRSCQLVLGAGALQVVGLKTITTKNLALSSRCLQLIVHYIPIIRAHFEARLQPKQYSMLRHFDHITKDYHDHIAEISAKLVAIMDSLFDKLLSKYEVKAPVPSACFRNICKQMAKMHEAIYDLLPEEQTQMLFLRINASYKLHLKRQLAHLNVVNDGGPLNGLVTSDVAFYTGNLQALKGLNNLDLNMAEIWEQKR
ncbi:vacuolar protein sorting-associated protein 54 isoform X6 [Strigops habroptila]|uniref:vacuolar protein sorting-associated protein 54 isoform X6 n=1 Tax=Strigops habroptila TaxID=2489341 RepID=UPI0011CF485B|nr:vacuolar protein sorting-associated protein 54 isoform X6 [Strigops habroptila]